MLTILSPDRSPAFQANDAHLRALVADLVVVNHHLFFADLSVRESGMAELLPTVRVAAGVQRDRPDVDARALPRLVVAADVEHDLVAVDVRVVVGHRDRQRVVVDLARQEVADHEVPALEDLVAFLRRQNCEEAQGYYFSRPMPAFSRGNTRIRYSATATNTQNRMRDIGR